MIIRCPTCASTQTRLTGQTHYWIDADGGWHYLEGECLECGARMVIDEKGFAHLLADTTAAVEGKETHHAPPYRGIFGTA